MTPPIMDRNGWINALAQADQAKINQLRSALYDEQWIAMHPPKTADALRNLRDLLNQVRPQH